MKARRITELVYKTSRFFSDQSIETVYKRPLPKFLTSFSSEQGKKLFKEALNEGNMQCYFPLSEQFMTQLEPSTCGSTTLAMVLNALSLDPKRRWKGIWRWYSEDTIEGMKAQYIAEGIDLENFSHITRHNNASIQTFYYPHDFVHAHGKYDCEHGCPKQLIRTASFTTFVACLTACCRRTGLFIVLNQSRQALGQTGDGHFQPVGGLNLKQGKALLLDVARFKYPPYWCSLDLLYQSLERLDSATKRPRGFALISRDLESFSQICSISADEVSRKGVQQKLASPDFMKTYKIPDSSEEQPAEFFCQFLKELGFDFNVLLVYNLYEVIDYLERQREQANHLIQTVKESPVYELAERILFSLIQDNNSLGVLIHEFCGVHEAFVLSLLLLSIPQKHLKKTPSQLFRTGTETLFEQLSIKKDACTDLDIETRAYLQKIVFSFKNNLF